MDVIIFELVTHPHFSPLRNMSIHPTFYIFYWLGSIQFLHTEYIYIVFFIGCSIRTFQGWTSIAFSAAGPPNIAAFLAETACSHAICAEVLLLMGVITHGDLMGYPLVI